MFTVHIVKCHRGECYKGANLTLFDRWGDLCITLFTQNKESDGQHELACQLLPVCKNTSQYNLRNKQMVAMPSVKTKRFQNSLIMHFTAKYIIS